jgi:nicotinate-nucleotide pyrophosphorylase (carboxylating)
MTERTQKKMRHAGQADFNPKQLVKQAEILLKEAFGEDLGAAGDLRGDITAMATVPAHRMGRARIEARQSGRVCGLPIVREVFRRVARSEKLELSFLVEEGEQVHSGQRLLVISGSLRSILAGERIALNFLGRLSGIATAAAQACALAMAPPVILDTRKTTPAWRTLEKYAVAKGGAQNHRMGLCDMFLIKENHIAAAGGISQALEAAKALRLERELDCSIEIEVETFSQLEEVLQVGADIVMLDNFTPADVRKAREVVAGRLLLEVSGGITDETLPSYAATGVDFISMGALTHSAPAFDFSLLVEAVE